VKCTQQDQGIQLTSPSDLVPDSWCCLVDDTGFDTIKCGILGRADIDRCGRSRDGIVTKVIDCVRPVLFGAQDEITKIDKQVSSHQNVISFAFAGIPVSRALEAAAIVIRDYAL